VPNYIKRAQLDHGKEFYTALIYLGFSILVVSFALKLIDPAVVTREGRFEGVFGNPNGMGLFSLLFCMLFNIILNMYPDLIAPRWKRIIYIAIFLAIILCGSRGSLFGILIYFLFSFIYKKSSFIGTVLAILFAFSYSYISYNIVNIITLLKLEDYLRINTFEEASGRFIAWKFTWDHIQENFWIGRGFEYTTYLFSIPENVVYLNSLGHLGNVHNSYLTLWLDTGLVGLSAFVIAFISCFISAIRKTILAIPLMYAAVFSSFFESWLTASLNPFTIILFITLSIILSNVTIPAKASPAVSLQ
jgi:O-antigen ligase